MTQPIERDPIYRGRRFQTETIELCVRWYCLDAARTRHQVARSLLADGIDPSARKRALGKQAFAISRDYS